MRAALVFGQSAASRARRPGNFASPYFSMRRATLYRPRRPQGSHSIDRVGVRKSERVTAGFLAGRVVLIAWTQRGTSRRVISMRYCHAKEVRKFRRLFPEAFGDET